MKMKEEKLIIESELAFLAPREGKFIMEMRDAKTEELQERTEYKNVITLDASKLAARLFKNNLEPSIASGNSVAGGMSYMAFGTGAVTFLAGGFDPQNPPAANST